MNLLPILGDLRQKMSPGRGSPTEAQVQVKGGRWSSTPPHIFTVTCSVTIMCRLWKIEASKGRLPKQPRA